MHIELTDHLRCPGDHPEAFVVLLPATMDGRDVIAGDLGCPVCGWSIHWDDRIPDFGGGTVSTASPPFDADALAALLGVDGPGGWIALAGSLAGLAPALADLLPGVSVIAVNPPGAVSDDPRIQVLRSGRWPIRRASMRGVAVGGDAAGFLPDAIGSALPGLRVVGEGEPPGDIGAAALLASGDGVWVLQAR